MPELTVTRRKDSAAFARRMSFLVDGERVARLWRGGRHVVDVGVGSHTVQAKMDWTTSEPLTVEVADGESVGFEGAIEFRDRKAIWRHPGSALHLHQL